MDIDSDEAGKERQKRKRDDDSFEQNPAVPPAFCIWEMIVNPLKSLFEDLETSHEDLKALIYSLAKACKDSTDTFYPSGKGVSPPTYELWVQQYTNFDMWLLGRLFYMLGYEKLQYLHAVCTEAQLNILYILQVNHYEIFERILQEYLHYLTDLAELQVQQTLCSRVPVTIERFSSQHDVCPGLDLTQINVSICDENMCSNLLCHVLQIFTSLISSISEHIPLFLKLWKIVCMLVECGSVGVKISSLKMLSVMLQNNASDSPEFVRHFIYVLRAITNASWADLSDADYERLCDAVRTSLQAFINSGKSVLALHKDHLIDVGLESLLADERDCVALEHLHSCASDLVVKLLAEDVQLDDARIEALGNAATKPCIKVLMYCVIRELQATSPRGNEHPSVAKQDCEVLIAQDVSSTWYKMYTRFLYIMEFTTSVSDVHVLLSLLRELHDTVFWVAAACTLQEKPFQNVRFFGENVELMIMFLVDAINRMPRDFSDNVKSNVVEKTIKIAGCFLQVPEMENVSAKALNTAIALVSLPWVDENSEFLDLGKEFVDNFDIASFKTTRFKCFLDPSLRMECLDQLARAPRDTAESWRLGVVRQCLSGPDGALRARAVAGVPVLLSANCHSVAAADVLSAALGQRDPVVELALSRVFGIVACVLSGDHRLTRVVCEDSYVRHRAECRRCDGPESGGEHGSRCPPVAERLLAGLASLLDSRLAEVRLNAARALPRLCRHLDRGGRCLEPARWLALLRDDDRAVRLELAGAVAPLALARGPAPRPGCDSLAGLCGKQLVAAVRSSLAEPREELQDSCMRAVAEIGRIPEENTLLLVVGLMIVYALHPASCKSSVVKVHLNQIASARNTSPDILFCQVQDELSDVMADLLLQNQSCSNNFVSCVSKLAQAFGIAVSLEFVGGLICQLLPVVVAAVPGSREARRLVGEMALAKKMDAKQLVDEQFQYIYPHIYMLRNEDNLQGCISFMEEVTGYSVSKLKWRSFKALCSEFLLSYKFRSTEVVNALKELVTHKSESKDSTELVTAENLADKLQRQFLGVMVCFDDRLRSGSVSDAVKRRALLSLPGVIRLMGPRHVTPIRFKVLAILRSALQLRSSNFPDLCCASWDSFVHNIDISTVGPLLGTIFTSLLPYLEDFQEEVSSIFHFLVRQDILKPYLKDLYFVPNHPAIEGVYATIQENIVTGRPFLDTLKDALSYITHENMDIRSHGLKRLKKLLESNYVQFQNCVVGAEGLDPVVTEVVESLISNCSDTDISVAQGCAMCLGEIGAIDPGNLPRRKSTAERAAFPLSVKTDSFAVAALNELVRSFQTCRNSENLDGFSLAIQELLKAYSISPNAKASKRHLWDSFPDFMKEIMSPLLTSSYKITVNRVSTYVHPVYGSRYGKSLTDWAFHWIIKLIPLMEDKFAESIFDSCLFAMKNSAQVLLFFLPYVVVHALFASSQETKRMILEELLAPLGSALPAPSSSGAAAFLPLHRSPPRASPPRAPGPPGPRGGGRRGGGPRPRTKAVCTLLDFLDRWRREWRPGACVEEAHFTSVREFCSHISKLTVATANYNCMEYPRALIYAETYIKEHPDEFQNQLPLLTKIFAQLDEKDAVSGILTTQQQEPSLEDLILAHEVMGNLQDVSSCYERLAQEKLLTPQFMKGMVRCYLALDQPVMALRATENILTHSPHLAVVMCEQQAEAFWQLHMFDELAGLVSRPEFAGDRSWGIQVGRILTDFRRLDRDGLRENVEAARRMLLEALATSSLDKGAYHNGYEEVVRLQMLNEVEAAEEMVRGALRGTGDAGAVQALAHKWGLKLECVQQSAGVLEPILALRRTLLDLARRLLEPGASGALEPLVGRLWLSSAELARRAGSYHQAYNCIMNAQKCHLKEVFVEKAKWHWERGEQELAFMTLRRGLEEHFPDSASFKNMASDERKDDRKLCAEAKLLIATYNDETANVTMDVNINHYKEAMEPYREWEKSLVCLAQYYDRVVSTVAPEERDLKFGDLQVNAIHCFLKSLQYGCNHIYQSMPRLLSIWLDYGTRFYDATKIRTSATTIEIMKSHMEKMSNLIDTYLDRLPPYMFLTAFSQIISRVCHTLPDVYKRVKAIIVNLLIVYPQQCMWMFISSCKSSFPALAKRSQEILHDPAVKQAKLSKLINDFNNLSDKLIELINTRIDDNVTSTTVSAIVRTLPLLFRSNFSPIMLPMQKQRSIMLPSSEDGIQTHDPFPRSVVYIEGMLEEVTILSSLQKPRRFSFRGSDGQEYMIMGKPKDDLRKDFRIMEFHSIINKYLHKDPESRQRGLKIRTYSVVPLNEECGIVEWVPNLIGLRPIMLKLLKEKGQHVSGRELKKMMCAVSDPLPKKRQVYLEQLLPKHPPILEEWFRQTFADPYNWFCARTAYIRTAAVMSVVGYIVGLGDRHGENILLDSTTGDAIHVDFNCLFNKGETFDWPERVPFRLTHNMVVAMGPMGVEGTFRRTCEITLRMIRNQQNALMSVLRPFVYDPTATLGNMSRKGHYEFTNEQAVKHIQNIELRIQGRVKSKNKSFTLSLLSVEGQVNNLIQEATSIDNLCQMYIGWGAFL
ncbi:LOW QUALITY PROTEIN: serine/threonine-protein kinase ATR [Bacillus rossius redtenbacheri]|uniref:LOW QUALITY PROTEIN: serine/threonine-protein kinase ATR n=1 Tax=Bacillus rossius redtenbacheri TaxID=93214 RepID=UPI002FDC974E